MTLVTGAWNLLNLIIAGCALGVVSERATRRQSHRVRVERPCRFIMGDEIIDAVLKDVSVGGGRLHVPPSAEPRLKKGTAGTLEFQPFANLPIQQLPVEIRKVGMDDKGLLLGCRFLIEKAGTSADDRRPRLPPMQTSGATSRGTGTMTSASSAGRCGSSWSRSIRPDAVSPISSACRGSAAPARRRPPSGPRLPSRGASCVWS